jgi:hypothetical protein
MYLHLGQSVVVPAGSVVGIFDLDNASQSHLTRRFLREAEEAGNVVSVSAELPKAFAVCFENGRQTVYLSQISAPTLQKRAEGNSFE